MCQTRAVTTLSGLPINPRARAASAVVWANAPVRTKGLQPGPDGLLDRVISKPQTCLFTHEATIPPGITSAHFVRVSRAAVGDDQVGRDADDETGSE